jgi:hypothetical protein
MVLLLAALLAVEAPPLAVKDVQAVVDLWLAAQNKGDFAAYDKLFAARFTGVRRSGPRTVRLDRAGWMKDRARMFRKPMTVAISGVEIRTGGSSALVSFTQAFAQGNYKDTGPKELVVIREGGALKISSEILLRSRIESAPVPAADERFRFVVSKAVLLSSQPVESWATGAATYHAGDPTVAARRVDPAKLPPELARWQGRHLRLVAAAGAACEANVTGFRLLSRSVPHFGDVQAWKDMKPATVARQAWDLGAKVLVADVDKACAGAFWAQPVGTPAPATDSGEAADAALKARALGELRRSAAWKEIQKSYLESPEKGVERWDQLDQVDVDVRRFRAQVKGKPIALLSVTMTRNVGCADFGAALLALYEDRNGKLVARNTPGLTAVRPLAAVDSDGDGNSELLFEPLPYGDFATEKGRLILEGGLWDSVEEVAVPYLDCPC